MKTYFNWSSGKDSALALYHLLQNPTFEVAQLLTTMSATHQRVSMHGIRKTLLKKQLQAIQIPYEIVEIPDQCINEQYESIMQQSVSQLKNQGFTHAAFGDIFLEDLKTYREQQLNKLGMKATFPLWQKNTLYIIDEIIDLGFKCITVATNAQLLDASFVGRIIDKGFIKDLPKNVDPCGEYGEFHTFCYEAPYFSHPIDFSIGEKVYKTYQHGDNSYGYWFLDLIPT